MPIRKIFSFEKMSRVIIKKLIFTQLFFFRSNNPSLVFKNIPLVNLGNIYQAAPPKNNHSLLQWKDKNIALGICFEEYFDSWYFSKKQPIAMYVFLNSESLFNKWGKHFLKNTASSKARQWIAPSLRTTFAGYSGFWQFAKEEKISQKKDYLTGEVFLNGAPSFFLSLGKIIYSLNFIFFVVLLLCLKKKLK